jgi:gas vesicle structural protein
VNRLDLSETNNTQTLPEFIEDLQQGGAKKKTKGMLEGAKDKVTDVFDTDDDENDEQDDEDDGQEEQEERPRRRSRRVSSSNGRRTTRRRARERE